MYFLHFVPFSKLNCSIPTVTFRLILCLYSIFTDRAQHCSVAFNCSSHYAEESETCGKIKSIASCRGHLTPANHTPFSDSVFLRTPRFTFTGQSVLLGLQNKMIRQYVQVKTLSSHQLSPAIVLLKQGVRAMR